MYPYDDDPQTPKEDPEYPENGVCIHQGALLQWLYSEGSYHDAIR